MEHNEKNRREGDRNEAFLMGRLKDKAVVRNFGEVTRGEAGAAAQDKTRAQFTILVERPGRGKPFYDYVLVTAWHELARQAAALDKGDAVEVEGRLRTWQGEKGWGWGVEADMLKAAGKEASRQEADAGVAAAGV